MKRTYTVKYTIATRVEVDVPDGLKESETQEWYQNVDSKVIPAAREAILSDIENQLINDNVTLVDAEWEKIDAGDNTPMNKYCILLPDGNLLSEFGSEVYFYDYNKAVKRSRQIKNSVVLYFG